MNKVILIGNVTKDADRQVSVNGKAYTRFTVAVNRRGVEGADFFNVVAWGKLAESCAAFLTKGKKVYVEGSIRFGEYVDSNGVKRITIDVAAQSVEFLSPVENREQTVAEGVRERLEDVTPENDSNLPF